MADAEEAVSGRRIRRWRSVSEKRQIVQMTQWRRAFERGELVEPYGLLPVTISSPSEPVQETLKVSTDEQALSGGSIHIELPGRAVISVERGADPTLLRFILESLRK